jgi:hypothetical protein
MSKNVLNDSAWSAGAAGNSLPSVAQGLGRSADTWYGVFLIGGRGIATDWGLDTSLTATNLLAAAQSVSALYTKYRRIGWIRTDGSENVVQWIQQGDLFHWNTPQAAYNATADFRTEVVATLTYCPPSVEGIFVIDWSDISSNTDPFLVGNADAATLGSPSFTSAPGASMKEQGGAFGANELRRWVNASRQIRIRTAGADASSTVYVIVHGWRDHRGRES